MEIDNFLSRIVKSRYNTTIHGNLIRQLNIFQDLYKTRNIKRTAINLLMSPSSITRQIQKLEYAIGTALIYRHGCRGVSITPEGEEVNKYAAKILSTITEMSEMTLLDKTTNVIKISAHPLAFPTYVLPVIKKLKELTPEVNIEILMLTKEEAISKLSNKQIDIICYPFETEKMRIFYNEEYNVFVGREYETALYMHKNHKLANKDDQAYTIEDMALANMMPKHKDRFDCFKKLFPNEAKISTSVFDVALLYYGVKNNLWSFGTGSELEDIFDCSDFSKMRYNNTKFHSTIFHWHIISCKNHKTDKIAKLLANAVKC